MKCTVAHSKVIAALGVVCVCCLQSSAGPAQSSTTPDSASQASSSSTTASSSAGKQAGSGKSLRAKGSRKAAGSTSSSSHNPPVTAAEKAELKLAKQLSEADFNNLQLYSLWASQPPASASFKLDGSLIIAFVWRDQLFTCTRQRMSSEQVCCCPFHVWGMSSHGVAGQCWQ